MHLFFFFFQFNIFNFILLPFVFVNVFSLLFLDGKTMFDFALINNFLEKAMSYANVSYNKSI